MLPTRVSVLPALSFEKIKAGVFHWPQIGALIRGLEFIRRMNHKERGAWFSCGAVMENVLGIKKVNNYETLAKNLFYDLGCDISVNLHFLFRHIDRFPENVVKVSAEKDERFHQDLKNMEEGYQGRLNKHMMECYCLNIKRGCPKTVH